MPIINSQTKEMQNGDVVLSYTNTVGPQSETFTFATAQETVVLKNKGSKDITYTLGGQSGILSRSQQVKVTGSITDIILSSQAGTQQFEVWAEEAGTKGVSDGAISTLDGKVTDLTTQLAQMSNDLNNIENGINTLDTTKADKTELHSHLNKTTLDKFGESNGQPTFSGQAIGGGSGSNVTDSTTNGNILVNGAEVKVYDDSAIVKRVNGISPDASGNVTVSGEGGSSISLYKTEPIGEIFDQPAGNTYLAWPAGNLKYDSSLKKFVCIVNVADQHLFTTLNQYICFIDPNELSKPTLMPITANNLTLDESGICNFIILPNGDYMMIATASNINYRIISTDKGVTWTSTGALTGNTNVHFWAIYRLSNGRLIGSIDVANKGFYYSDDDGFSWTNVVPAGTPGNYNAEGCIVELGDNKLMAIARKSMSGIGSSTSGASEKAIISYSTNNGTTWSAWAESTTISMNASCATAIVHDGIVELFVGSRWYYNTTNGTANTDYTNTGKTGAILHYHATVENALTDNFTYDGVVEYAKAVGSMSSQDFHSPCVATDSNGDMLMVYFDRTYPYTTDSTNYYFIRGSLKDLRYKRVDNAQSVFFSYSSVQIEKLLKDRDLQIATLQYALSQIEGSGVTPPSGVEVVTYSHDFNALNALIDNTSPFYNNIYTKNTSVISGSGYQYVIATNTLDSAKKVFKQQKNTMIAYPTKANFMTEIKASFRTNIGVGLVIYDGGKYYGLHTYTGTSYSNGSTFSVSNSTFNNVMHTIKVKKDNGAYTLVVDGVEYTCGPMNALDSSSIIETYGTATWNHYDPATNTLAGGTFTAIPQQPLIFIASTSNGGTVHNEIEYIKFGEWD